MIRRVERITKPLRDVQRSYRAVLDSVDSVVEGHASMMELIQPLQEIAAAVQPSLDQLASVGIRSPGFEVVSNANRTLAVWLEQQSKIDVFAEQSRLLSTQWRSLVEPIQKLTNRVHASQITLASHYSSIADASLLAQRLMPRVNWGTGSSTVLAASDISVIKHPFVEFTLSYSSLIQSFRLPDVSIVELPPIVSSGPPVEVLASADLLERLVEPTSFRSEDDREFLDSLEAGIDGSLESLLAQLDAELVSLWRGAKSSLSTTNDDRARHIAVSLRELLTHTLHKLAPDSRIQNWSSDPSHFHKDRPTRKARFLYICRSIDHAPFVAFVRKDAESAAAFLDLFQGGTHALRSQFTETQLRALVFRTECFLRFILSIAT